MSLLVEVNIIDDSGRPELWRSVAHLYREVSSDSLNSDSLAIAGEIEEACWGYLFNQEEMTLAESQGAPSQAAPDSSDTTLVGVPRSEGQPTS